MAASLAAFIPPIKRPEQDEAEQWPIANLIKEQRPKSRAQDQIGECAGYRLLTTLCAYLILIWLVVGCKNHRRWPNCTI